VNWKSGSIDRAMPSVRPLMTTTQHALSTTPKWTSLGTPCCKSLEKCRCWRPTARWRFGSKRRRTGPRRFVGPSVALRSTVVMPPDPKPSRILGRESPPTRRSSLTRAGFQSMPYPSRLSRRMARPSRH
jgi:hypothetical protein